MDIVGILIIGIISAWIINYLADVLPVRRKISTPVCVSCHAKIAWKDYLLFHRCGNCGKPRSLRTWLVFLATPLVGVLLYIYPPARLGFWIGFSLLVFFGLIAVIDIEYRAILQAVNILAAVVGLGIGLMNRSILETLLGGVAGFAIMLGLYFFGIFFNRLIGRIRKIEVDEVALGLGDVYLMGGLGLMMGWPEVLGGVLLAILLGGLFSGLIILVSWLIHRYQPMQAIPYAPFLLLATVIMVYIPKQ